MSSPQVAQRINATNQLVELKDGLARAVMPGQGANFAHKDALAHLLQSQRSGNLIHIKKIGV